MLDQLKELAASKLQEVMQPNQLNVENTSAAAQEGASELLNVLKDKISSGNLGEVKDLFNKSGNLEQNGLFQSLQEKLQGVLQNKGMNLDEALSEAKSIAPNLINTLRDKFASTADSDKAFDLGQLEGLFGGNAGSLLDKAKNLFK